MANDSTSQKKCSKCHAQKSVSLFVKQARAKDGLHPWCKECKKSNDADFYVAHKQRVRANQKKYYDLHKEELLDQSKNRGLIWRKCNQHKDAEKVARYRAAKKNRVPAKMDEFEVFGIKETYHLAKLRTKLLGVKFHVDHIVPLQGKSVCGLHVLANLKVILAQENWSKNNRRWPDMWEHQL